ncbi:hypothetical protein CY652_23450 [Burkholderia sp. WAC0059]|nr:hypothetical protein CY652_23450 [Burkholderia sp. WAC0059]
MSSFALGSAVKPAWERMDAGKRGYSGMGIRFRLRDLTCIRSLPGAPRQTRGQARVGVILDAATQVIVEEGLA